MVKREWLAKQLDIIIEYAIAEADNDVYNTVMLLRTYLLKKG